MLRQVPIEQSIRKLNLMDVLESGIKHAAATNNRDLSQQINRILEVSADVCVALCVALCVAMCACAEDAPTCRTFRSWRAMGW